MPRTSPSEGGVWAETLAPPLYNLAHKDFLAELIAIVIHHNNIMYRYFLQYPEPMVSIRLRSLVWYSTLG
jgi:hypothetical protein